MIRSRKDESGTAAAVTTTATTKISSTVAATPPPKRSSGSTTGTTSSVLEEKASNPVASPASISSSFAALSASSLQYYSHLVAAQGHRVRGTVKKKSSKKKMADATLWSQVQMPKRMLWSTMSIFLVIPVLLFLWKETHIRSIDQAELRGKQYGGKSVLSATMVRKKNKHQEFVTWMANQATPEEELSEMVNDTISSSSDSEAEPLNMTIDDGEALPFEARHPESDMALDVRAAGKDPKEARVEERQPLTAAEFQEEEEEGENKEEDDTDAQEE
jgi:hypothetical protein